MPFMIEKNPAFDDSLFAILKYIANDSPNNARKFKSKIDRTIKNLSNMPFKFRKSHYYKSENVRDLIFKGYTIPYVIDSEKYKIVVLDIFKWSDR